MKIGLLVALVAVCVPCFAQEAKPRAGQSVRSPEVLADGRVTFRCKAPNAKEVWVEGEDLPKLVMTRDDNGVWSATTRPLDPDFYNYNFVIDGVVADDPANTDSKEVAVGGRESIVHVPGPATLSWEPGNVPHGVLRRQRYRSGILGEDRDFYVYTPPGYEEGKKVYPVLYLLHGVTENETAWEAGGKASVILDNLIAWHKATPMILVMPNGYGFPGVADHMELQFGMPDEQRRLMDTFTKVLLNEIVPRVEKGYRTGARAIAGVSMGGAQALYIGINHHALFDSVGAFSPAVIMYGLPYDKWFPTSGSFPEVSMYCGTEDFLIGANRQIEKWFKGQQVPARVTEMPGMHTWNVWRRCFTDFASKVFQKK